MTPSEKNLSHEISIHYQPQLVQIVCDQNLKDYLREKGNIVCDQNLKDYLREKGNGSLQLADYILKEYQHCQHTPLKISRDSLAIEILAHTYVDSFSQAVSAAQPLLPLSLRQALKQLIHSIRSHTEIIDCGETEVDSNRWIWDKLAPYKSIIYGALGDRA